MSSNSPHFSPNAQDAQGEKNGNTITIKPRGFNTVWGNDSRYWHLPVEGIKDDHAELVQVSWLEVTGSVELDQGKKYEISFEVSLRADAFGWNGCPVFMMAKIGKKGKYICKRLKPLDSLYGKQNLEIPQEDKFCISVTKNATEKQLFFGLYEVWSGKWKGGLVIHKAIIKEVGNSDD